MTGNDSNGSYVGDNNNSFEEEMPSQPQAFHDFVFGKGNAERLWKIADEIAKEFFNYWAGKSGFDKVEPASNYNAIIHFICILTGDDKSISSVNNSLVISDNSKQILQSMYKLEIDNNNVNSDSNANERLFSQYIKKFSSDDQQILRSVFNMSWYNKIRNYCYPNGVPQGERRESFFSYIEELLKCMVVIDILSLELDGFGKNITNSENDFETAIREYFSDEARIKNRLYFIASNFGCEKYDDKKDFIAQFFQAYIDYKFEKEPKNKKNVMDLFVEYNSERMKTLQTEENNDTAMTVVANSIKIIKDLSETNNQTTETDDKGEYSVINLFENIWFWRFLSLGATVLSLILMIVFINVWFYFIVPCVILAFVTLGLFLYKPTSENEVKEDLKNGKSESPSQSSKHEPVPERDSTLQNKQNTI